jgi:hypothetical protein|tara:strand:- start:722 stop:856 length:135 start_codon:yes stop_codon:yes gene_type:complete
MANYFLVAGILILSLIAAVGTIGLIWLIAWITDKERKNLKESLE